MSEDGCEMCGEIHATLKYARGEKVRALSMMPHILKYNPFADPVVDRTGHEGIIVKAHEWERIKKTAYIVNFNSNPAGPWHQAPFNECQLEPVATQKR